MSLTCRNCTNGWTGGGVRAINLDFYYSAHLLAHFSGLPLFLAGLFFYLAGGALQTHWLILRAVKVDRARQVKLTQQLLERCQAFLIRSRPVFFIIVHFAIDQRLDFCDIRRLKRVIPHRCYLVQVLLLAPIEQRLKSGEGLSDRCVLLPEYKLFAAPPFLNPVDYLRIMRSNAANQLLLELFIRKCFLWLARQRVKSWTSTTRKVVHLLVVHRVLEEHA